MEHHRRIDGHGGPVHLNQVAKSAEKRPGDLEPDLSTLVVANVGECSLDLATEVPGDPVWSLRRPEATSLSLEPQRQ